MRCIRPGRLGFREEARVTQKYASDPFELTLRGKPLAANPKTSALTVYSVVRALHNRSRALSI